MSARRGVWIFLALLILLGVAVLVAAIRLDRPSGVADGTVLVLDVPSQIEETTLPFPSFPMGWVARSRTTVSVLVQAIDRAAEDDRVAALVLHVADLEWGWGKIAEVRDALLRFRESGKPVYASLAGGGEAEYLLASAAGTVAMPEAAVLQLNGLAASAVFLRGGLDKLGIRPNFAQVGRFKSAVESYTSTGMSPDTRRALEAVLDDTWGWLTDSLGTARALGGERVRRLFDEGPYGGTAALEAGLVDTLLHETDLDSLALRDAGAGTTTLTMGRYLMRAPSDRGGTRLALVAASGAIAPGRSRYSPSEGLVLGTETVIEALRQARTRRAVKAVVLRIDSPGGTLDAADEIWREIKRCREVKPVVVSMSDYAASGGYYLAVAGNPIVAQPSTVTGSIGIYGGKLNLLGLYHKLGLSVETIARGRHAEMLSPFRDFTPDEAERYQRQLEDGYRLFLSRVAEGRGISMEAVDSLAQGRVWSGIEAHEVGLVDTLGGLETAFGLALVRAGYARDDAYTIERFPRVEHSFLERLVEEWLGQGEREVQEVLVSPVLRAWMAAARFPSGAALALMPYSIEID